MTSPEGAKGAKPTDPEGTSTVSPEVPDSTADPAPQDDPTPPRARADRLGRPGAGPGGGPGGRADPDRTPGARRAARLAAARNAEDAQDGVPSQPGAQRNAGQGAAAAAPGAQRPGAQGPAAAAPGAQRPGAQGPAAAAPGAQRPGAQGPAAAAPGAQRPGAQGPAGGRDGPAQGNRGPAAGRAAPAQGGQGPAGGRNAQAVDAQARNTQVARPGSAVAAQGARMPVAVRGDSVPALSVGGDVAVGPAPAVAAEPARATYSPSPVPPAKVRRRHRFMVASFLFLVVLPVVAMFYYLYEHAQDRFASDAAFFVHREDTTTSVESVFGLGGIGGSGGAPDADVLYQFIQSQQMVQLADDRLDLRAMYSPFYDIDPVFALKPEATLEELVEYWGKVVSMVFAPDNGLINLEVIAYDPDDAHALAEVILEESANLIERLSQIAREDTIAQAQADLALAEDRLKTARVAIAEFRSDTDFVDPSAGVAGAEGLITALQQELANELINRDTLMGTTTRPDDPRIERADRKIASIRERIDEERGKVGSDQALAVGAYEVLLVDRQFAEQSYTAALAAYDAAVAEARRKSRYLAIHIEPTLADTAIYPRRITLGIVGAGFIFMIWAIFMLVLYSFHDRR